MQTETPTPATPKQQTTEPAKVADAANAVAEELDQGWVGWLLGVLRHEPAHALTLFYIGVSALGLWASYWFFRSFGIPIADYMDPSDYITAGLRDPAYLLIVLLAVLLTVLLNFHEYARRRGEDYYRQCRAHWWGRALLWRAYRPPAPGWVQRSLGWKNWSVPTAVLFGLLWATLWMTVAYVQEKAAHIRAGGGHAVRITLAHTHEVQPGTARLLGAIGDFVFLYWPERGRAEAIAVEEVGRLESVSPAPARVQPAPVHPSAKPASHASGKSRQPAPAH